MANEKAPVAAQTKLNNEETTDAKVDLPRKVTYIFDTTATSETLSIPYAVAIDGVVQPEFKDSVKRVAGARKKKLVLGRIEVPVKAGAKVTLYLNSDAYPSYRQNPVYEASADARNVEVTITEKMGKHSDTDTPTFSATDEKTQVDAYTAPLTGDIWMKISHKYTSGDVDGSVPADTGAEVKTAIKSIYDGLTQNKVTASIAATATAAATLISMTFDDSSNAKDNIVTYTLLGDGLTRVHPAGYAALFNAAAATSVTKLNMTSAWRPLMGSIAHRVGLGLDVNYVNDIRINRAELRGGVDTPNVSDDEKTLFSAFEAARKREDDAEKAEEQARKAHAKVKADPAKAPAAEEAVAKAKEETKAAAEQRTAAEKAWNDERDKNEPEIVKAFRGALKASPVVTQVLDPWFMDYKTSDAALKTNVQLSGDEKGHNNHLHVTIKESSIL